jgi:arylsulfatase A-like enzyme
MNIRNWRGLVGALVLLVAPAAWAKNYLVVIMDDVAVDKVSSYAADYPGYTPSFLPNTQTIDSLAAAGLRFTRAWATPLCSPTRASFQTGQQPFRHGIGTALGDSSNGLDSSITPMLAKSMASTHATGLFGKYHIGTKDANNSRGVPRDATGALAATFTTEPHPSLTGWERFFGGYDGEPNTSAAEDTGYFQWIRVGWFQGGSGHTGVETTHASQRVEEEALSWINARTEPWLAVVAFNAAHSTSGSFGDWGYDAVNKPATNPKTHIKTRTPALACLTTHSCLAPSLKRQVYQALVEDMDLKIEALLDGMDAQTLDDTTIIVFGDNGTPGQDNGTINAVQESIFNVAGRGKATVYENGVRVPLIVADGKSWRRGIPGPTITAPGRTLDARVNTLDIFNTLFTDANMVSLANIDSMPFNQCFTTNDVYCGWPKRYGYTETFPSTVSPVPANPSPHGAHVAVSWGEDTMVAHYNAAANKQCLEPEFYDTSTDPLETTKQIWPAARAQRLVDRFNAIHATVKSWAHPDLTKPVVPFCPYAVQLP